MFENGMLLVDYKDELIKAYNYDEGLAEDIAVMAKSIVDYYGTEYESVVLDAIMHTKVVLTNTYGKNGIRETVQDVLAKEGMEEEVFGKNGARAHDVRNVDGVYCEKPNISFKDGEYTIDSVKKVAVINSNYTPDSPYFLGKLAGELLKATKSQLRTYEIDGNTLTTRTGLAVRTEELTHRGNSVNRKFVSEEGNGLEDGINDYDKRAIMRESYYSDYDLEANRLTTLVGGCVLDLLQLRDVVRVAQMTKDTSSLESAIDAHTAEGYKEFVSRIDELHSLEKSRNAFMSEQEIRELNEKIDKKYNTEIAPMIENMRVSMKLGVGEDVIAKSEGTSL